MADSVYRGWPIGELTMWEPTLGQHLLARSSRPAGPHPGQWVVDGVSRITALCRMVGRQPLWEREPAEYRLQFDPWHDRFRHVDLGQGPAPTTLDDVAGLGVRPAWVDLPLVLAATQDDIWGLAPHQNPLSDITPALCRLSRLNRVLSRTVPSTSCRLEPEEAATLFSRLNR